MIEPAAKPIEEIPAPAAKEPGWYPDPLGSCTERYWDRSWQDFTRVPRSQLPLGSGASNGSVGPSGSANGHANGSADRHAPGSPSSNGQEARRPKKFSPLALVGIRPLPAEVDEGDKPRSKAERKRRREKEERKQEFFASPAGRARLSYGQKHEVFQCYLPLTRPELVVIPSVKGAAPRITADPVHILNSVVAEGWKLMAGEFFWADAGVGVVGYYLFKRSEKRHRSMNDPWKGEPEELT